MANSTILVPSTTSSTQWIPDERDAFILWIRAEFAAANAIIDALCGHLQISSTCSSDYDSVLACIHQRRYNWNPVLHMQHYYSISDVIFALQQVSTKKKKKVENTDLQPKDADSPTVNGEEESKKPSAEVLDNSSKRLSIPKFMSGFEDIDGQQVNVMEGLRIYDDVLDNTETEQLSTLVAESHAKKRKKGNKKSKSKAKDMIHFGTIPSDVPAGPVFKEETAEPMPPYLESVIDNLVKSQVIPASKRPDGCSISVLEPGDYMPPHNHHHFDEPIFILSLGSSSTLSFGRNLKPNASGEVDGKYKVTLSVGSILVLQGKSSELVQCAVTPLQTIRTLVTFGSLPRTSAKSKVKRLSPPLRSLSISPSLLASAASTTSSGTPIMLPVSSSTVQTPVAPMVMTSVVSSTASAYSPVSVVAPSRVPSPGTGVFLPANSSTAIYNAQHHMNRRHHYQHHNHFHAGRKELVA